jgi:cyclopropane fatty-acyl-phospholipid synthase-like methyltransferase
VRLAAALAVVLAFALAASGCTGTSGSHVHAGTHQHSFADAKAWAGVFDDPARDAWQRPDEVVRALALSGDAVVADIGAGTGYFSVRLAPAVPSGRVYAVDLEPEMVRHLDARAKEAGLANVQAVLGGTESPRLPAPVDLALLVDVYHHIGDREAYFARLRESLRPGGRLAIVDFRPESPRGPPRSSKLAPEQVRGELARAGFELAQEHTFLPDQYFLVFRSAKR